MAKPRVFISSTYYDLKHLRSSLENFVLSVGFEPILSEKGNIAFNPDAPLDESCYRVAESSDIFVLIVGGRYGSETSETKSEKRKEFFDRYESITKKEYRSAAENGVPLYILIDGSVYSEYHTFLKNRENSSVKYAHVDSVNIFEFMATILAERRNNPMHTFDRYKDIESWLLEQWSGLFKYFLDRRKEQDDIVRLSSKISELEEINKTLKTYLESIISSINPGKSKEVIEEESKRLDEFRKFHLLEKNKFFRHLLETGGLQPDMARTLIEKSDSQELLTKNLASMVESKTVRDKIMRTITNFPKALDDFNDARTILEKGKIE